MEDSFGECDNFASVGNACRLIGEYASSLPADSTEKQDLLNSVVLLSRLAMIEQRKRFEHFQNSRRGFFDSRKEKYLNDNPNLAPGSIVTFDGANYVVCITADQERQLARIAID
ncbi:hypothetical protein VN12_05115 [Pirellula sp. SH-Sr6A]|uniref:hypothetical protein n=1 Tax=Pirellula sp. SH-Sr6A TaxID=1632865 RepID=UPI00078B25B2|nr:hypothetical protein [Pirellula sp. SH-Sr6A]AMV31476.1 hypothetical protein VN12_05115 [Pirellula sp. SH-Sr6A]